MSPRATLLAGPGGRKAAMETISTFGDGSIGSVKIPIGAMSPIFAAPDIEKPPGEWNRIECVCEGNRISVILNGTLV